MADGDRGAFIWYELMTPDAAGAKAFYDAVVGWDVDGQGQALPNGGEYRMIKRSDGGNAGGLLSLSPDMIAGGASAGWLGYVHVPDVDEAAAKVSAAGGSVQMPPMDMPGIGRMAMVADPWGAHLYLMNPTPPPDQPDAKSDVFDYLKPQHVRWNELQTDDPAGALALYQDLFGWSQDGSMPMGELGDYQFIGREGGMFGAVMPRMKEAPASVWSYYIGVDDIDRAVGAVRDGGGTVIQEPIQIPGGDYSAMGVDPQGASFGLVGPRKG